MESPTNDRERTGDPTALTTEWRGALNALLPDAYEELRVVAHRQLQRREPGATLTTTGLVHEAYLRLAERSQVVWRDRGHFFALVALAMRHVLVDAARRRHADKREGARERIPLEHIPLDGEAFAGDDQAMTLLQLHDAIDRLADVEPRLAQVVDCRFFGGLADEEIAAMLHVTPRTVQRDWKKAQMLLRRALS